MGQKPSWLAQATRSDQFPRSDSANRPAAIHMIVRVIGLSLVPVAFACAAVVYYMRLMRLLPETVAQSPELGRWELIFGLFLVAYVLFAATWRRSVISRIAVILSQIVMVLLMVLTFTARI